MKCKGGCVWTVYVFYVFKNFISDLKQGTKKKEKNLKQLILT